MAKFENSVVINRPLEEVFAFVSNLENDPKWQSGVLESKKTSEGPIGVGTTYRTVGQFLGRRIESEIEITEYELNRKVSGKSKSGPIRFESHNTYERVEGTRVTVEAEAEIGGFFKLAEPLVINAAKRQIEGDSATLKDLLEAHAV